MGQSTKMTIGFFVGYFLLMMSLIGFAVFINSNNTPTTLPLQNTEPTTTFQEDLTKEELLEEENKNEEQKKSSSKVSEKFLIIAVSIAAVLDIIIVVLWARKENKKLSGKENSDKKRWRDTKIFWKIVTMGMIQLKNNKYSINWLNVIVITILLHVLLLSLLT